MGLEIGTKQWGAILGYIMRHLGSLRNDPVSFWGGSVNVLPEGEIFVYKVSQNSP